MQNHQGRYGLELFTVISHFLPTYLDQDQWHKMDKKMDGLTKNKMFYSFRFLPKLTFSHYDWMRFLAIIVSSTDSV